jgi:hypothetical protein
MMSVKNGSRVASDRMMCSPSAGIFPPTDARTPASYGMPWFSAIANRFAERSDGDERRAR